MTKLSNSIRAALLKKQAALHPAAQKNSDQPQIQIAPTAPVPKKVVKKHTGRGR